MQHVHRKTTASVEKSRDTVTQNDGMVKDNVTYTKTLASVECQGIELHTMPV